VAYLNQKYPYLFLQNKNINGKLKWDDFNGIEYIILEKLAKNLSLNIDISLYDKNKNYDIILGGIVYSKQIDSLFNSYLFLKYFTDSISVYCLKESNLNMESFLNSEDESIGVIMYSYAYYLIKQYIQKIKIYAYKEDILKDLLEGKILYIIIDDNFFDFPAQYLNKVKKIEILYKEDIGLFVAKYKNDLIQSLEKIISEINVSEILKWLK